MDERRRVDVTVGIIGDPDLLFLDEPTTGFDPSARREAWNMIEGLKQLGTTIVLTTHYMDEAQHLADRVAILRQGELVAMGDLAKIGAGAGAGTVIRFRVPQGVSAGDLRSIVEEPVELSGEVATIKVERPQRVLYRLTGWAEEKGLVLDALEAVHPTLEDIFLELTGDSDQATGDGPSG